MTQLQSDLLDLLDKRDPDDHISYDQKQLHSTASTIEAALETVGICGKNIGVHPGPAITRYELETSPLPTLPNILADLEHHIAKALGVGQVQIVFRSDTTGLSVVVPNRTRRNIKLRDVLVDRVGDFDRSWRMPVALGLDTVGEPVIEDLAAMPHLLVGGIAGTGKTTLMHGMLLTLLLTRSPDDVRTILIDPSGYSFTAYEDVPHLLFPVVHEAQDAVDALQWAVKEVARRLEAMKAAGVRRIDDLPVPRIVIAIDELADLMLAAREDVERRIIQIARQGRAVGIHLVIGTNRPSVDVLTRRILETVPSGICFRTTSKVDSSTVLGHEGAERLLRRGDALSLLWGAHGIRRVHTAMVADDEIRRVCEAVRVEQEQEQASR